MKGSERMDNTLETNQNEKEISLAQLFTVFKKSFVFMLIAAVIFAAVAAVYAVFVSKPSYKGTATFWVNSTSTNYDYASQAQTAAAASIATSCLELANADMPVRRAVQKNGLVEKLGYPDENSCVEAIQKMIKATKEDETSVVFYVSVMGKTPEEAYMIISALQSEIPATVQDLISIEKNENNAPMVSVIGPVSNQEQIMTVKSSPIKLGILAGAVAAIAVYVVFLLMMLFDTSVRNEETIKQNIESPIIGTIPSWHSSEEEFKSKKKIKTGKKGIEIANRNYSEKLLGNDSPFFVTEAFNTLRTNLIFSATAAKNPIFAVTSDVAGVGKTVVASNLAISLASLDKKVLLVECDMRCPTFSKLFKHKSEYGLSELLANMADGSNDTAYSYNDKLDVLFCGQIPPNPSELLASERMAELAAEWKQKYDFVILDMPPIGEVYDAGVVASVVNGYVLTVRCNYSNINDVKGAKTRIEQVGGSLLGVIVNDLNPKGGNKYGKYYAYKSYQARAKRMSENN